MKICSTLILILSSLLISAQALEYPVSSNIVDVTKAPYFADNTGSDDVTDILNRAFLENNDAHRIIYLPEGTYRISNTIRWGSPEGCNLGQTYTCHRYTVLAGAGIEKTIIKLDDFSAGYGDPAAGKLMLWTETSAAMSFENSVRNLSINSGSGNPGVSALAFEANNQGGLYNVKIISEDGMGLNGLHLGTGDQAGPMIVKGLEVDGYDVGIRTFANQNSIYFEDIVLRNQNMYGIYNRQQMISVKDLYSYNVVPVVYNQGDGGSMVTLINSVLEGHGAASQRVAFENYNKREVFLRNVNVSGYNHALQQLQNGFSLSLVPVGLIEEYTTNEPSRICDNVLKSLNLPIKETPLLNYEDTADWVSIAEYGAVLDNGFSGQGSIQDDTEALQDALNSGASTILVPSPVGPFPNRFIVYDTITIPSTVKNFIGSKGLLSGSFVLKILPGADTLFIEDFAQLQAIHHASERVLVVKKASIKKYTSLSNGTSGDVFIEDVVGGPYSFKNQHVWARQFNTEHDSINITNDGGTLWILGMKSEKKGTAIRTKNGGKTEVLGALFYGTKVEETIPKPIFVVEESSFSISTFKELGYIDDYWDVKVRETRNGVTNEYTQGNTPIRADLFVSYPASEANAAPVSDAGIDQILMLTEEETFLDGRSNDDGLPSGNCYATTLWTQVSGPTAIALEEAGDLKTRVTFSESGVYELELSVDDGALSAVDTVVISVYDHMSSTLDHNEDGIASGVGADANLRGWSNSEKNYGGGFSFGPKFYNSFPAKSIIRIDISEYDVTVVENARLEIEISSTNTGIIEDWEYNVFGLVDGTTGEDWVEGSADGEVVGGSEVTYDNAPGFSARHGGIYDIGDPGSGGVDHVKTQFLGKISTRKSRQEKVSFSSKALSDFINEDTDGRLSFLLTRETFALNTVTFASKEHPSFSPPTLYFDYCSQAPTVMLDQSATGTGSGISWQNAFTSIDEIFRSPCLREIKTILVAEGSYSPSTTDTSYSIVVAHDLTILGGYESGGARRAPAHYSTIISGSIGGGVSLQELLRIRKPEGMLKLDGVILAE